MSDANIRSLIAFVEEINHAVHGALQFRNGVREIQSEPFIRNLELQAQVDTYLVLLLFVAFFRRAQRISRTDRRWLRFHVFERSVPQAYANANLRGRYLETTPNSRRATPRSSTASTACAASRNSAAATLCPTTRRNSASSR